MPDDMIVGSGWMLRDQHTNVMLCLQTFNRFIRSYIHKSIKGGLTELRKIIYCYCFILINTATVSSSRLILQFAV